MRAHERKTCLELVDAGMDIGAHDTTRLIIYADAAESAAVKMYRAFITKQGPPLTPADMAEIKDVMKVALPPGEV